MSKAATDHWTGNPYKRPGSPFWSIVFTDAAGVVRRRSTKTKDLRIARAALAEQLDEIAKLRAGHTDRYAETRKQPLNELVIAYRDHLTQEGCNPRYVKETIRHVRTFVAFAKVSTLATIALADAERFTTEIRASHSAKTRDNCAGALRSFGRWLKRTGRWDVDPFDGLAIHTATKDKHRVFKRVGLRFEEAERLVEAAMARYEAERSHGGLPTHNEACDGDVVRDRQVLYWFSLTCAFRASECASVRWEDLSLDGPKPAVRLAGTFTKNGDDAHVPLQAFMVTALREMRKRRSANQLRRGLGPVLETDLVFHVPDKIARLVRKDAAFAGLIPQRGPTSKRIDFHALRKSCARILIEMNVHPKVIQQTLRHSDIRLTMDLYGELGEDDLFRELPGKFPVPKLFQATCRTSAAPIAVASI